MSVELLVEELWCLVWWVLAPGWLVAGERQLLAAMQRRRGTARLGWVGLGQGALDALKLAGKGAAGSGGGRAGLVVVAALSLWWAVRAGGGGGAWALVACWCGWAGSEAWVGAGLQGLERKVTGWGRQAIRRLWWVGVWATAMGSWWVVWGYRWRSGRWSFWPTLWSGGLALLGGAGLLVVAVRSPGDAGEAEGEVVGGLV